MQFKLKPISEEKEKFFYSLSFDINDFIGDGIWYLQIYDGNQHLIYDAPFASSMGKISKKKIKEVIKNEFIRLKDEIL